MEECSRGGLKSRLSIWALQDPWDYKRNCTRSGAVGGFRGGGGRSREADEGEAPVGTDRSRFSEDGGEMREGGESRHCHGERRNGGST